MSGDPAGPSLGGGTSACNHQHHQADDEPSDRRHPNDVRAESNRESCGAYTGTESHGRTKSGVCTKNDDRAENDERAEGSRQARRDDVHHPHQRRTAFHDSPQDCREQSSGSQDGCRQGHHAFHHRTQDECQRHRGPQDDDPQGRREQSSRPQGNRGRTSDRDARVDDERTRPQDDSAQNHRA